MSSKKGMDGETRREKILELLAGADQPLSGTGLAKQLGVSRQVVVQDIALLRAVDKNILSTNKGYLLYHQVPMVQRYTRSFRMNHSDHETSDELYCVVDLGGRILDVVVEHKIYGQLTVDLMIRTRAEADDFIRQLQSGNTKPLKDLTDGIHYHTVEADTNEILDKIEQQLREKNFLADVEDTY